jgi:CheY-like chemotaxis protein
MRGAVALMLEREGFEVAEADNGADALTYLRSGRMVNAIILDMAMPVMNGWDFLAACRKHSGWRLIPTIVLTGLMLDKRNREELDGMPVFTKPFNFDELLAAVRRVMIREVSPAPSAMRPPHR